MYAVNKLKELKFTRTVKKHGLGGKILLLSKDLEQFIGKGVEITVKEINHE